MMGPYESEEDMMEAILLWQRQYLEMKKQRNYFKQQCMDKDEELKECLRGLKK